MANTQFNGFKFIRSQGLSIETIVANCTSMYPGMMCFVRTSQNGGVIGSNEVGLDGYIVFNGKAYATGGVLAQQLLTEVSQYINEITKEGGTIDTRIGTAISDLTVTVTGNSNYVTVQVAQEDGRLTTVDVTDTALVSKLTAIESAISGITGDNGTIDTKINDAIGKLNSTIQTTGNTYINPTIVQENGKLKSITLNDQGLSDAINGLDAKISNLDANVSGSSENGYVTVQVVQTDGKLSGVTVESNVNKEALAIPGDSGSTKTGLVTAGQVENFVKTSVADLAGAMHFVGTTTVDPSTITGTTYKSGDVIINTENNKEYIYNGTRWVELGDEGLYVTKATTIAGVDLKDNITKEELLSKLNVADGAQVNVIEQVNVNGTKLEPSNKIVNVTIAEGKANGTIKVNGADVAVHGLGSAAYTDSTAYDRSGAAVDEVAKISGSTESTPSANYGIKVTTSQSAGKVTGITVDDSALKTTITGITNDISTLNTNAVKSVNGQTGNTITLTGENIAVGANVDSTGEMTTGSTVSSVLANIYTKIGNLSSTAYTGITSTGKTLTITGEGITQNVEVNLKADVDPGFIQLMKDETTGAIYGAMYYDGNESYTSPV